MKSILTTLLLCFAVVGILGGIYQYIYKVYVVVEKAVPAYKQGDYATALRESRTLAEMGNVIGQMFLGNMYHDGEGVTKDYKEAAKWFRLAAEQGHPRGQISLGVMYYDGLGVAQDKKEAAKWVRLAAEQGDGEAQFLMGLHFSGGNGVSQDNVKAQMWVNLAQANGFTVSPEIIDRFAQKLTATERSQAFKLAQECAENNFKDC